MTKVENCDHPGEDEDRLGIDVIICYKCQHEYRVSETLRTGRIRRYPLNSEKP